MHFIWILLLMFVLPVIVVAPFAFLTHRAGVGLARDLAEVQGFARSRVVDTVILAVFFALWSTITLLIVLVLTVPLIEALVGGFAIAGAITAGVNSSLMRRLREIDAKREMKQP